MVHLPPPQDSVPLVGVVASWLSRAILGHVKVCMPCSSKSVTNNPSVFTQHTKVEWGRQEGGRFLRCSASHLPIFGHSASSKTCPVGIWASHWIVEVKLFRLHGEREGQLPGFVKGSRCYFNERRVLQSSSPWWFLLAWTCHLVERDINLHNRLIELLSQYIESNRLGAAK